MLKHFHILKRAMRFYAAGEHPCALLELDAIIGTDKENDSSALFCLRGRVKQVRSRYPEAIADYMKALTIATPESLNQRNTLRILQNIIECSTRLDDNQRGPLHALLRKEFGLKKNDWFPLEMQFAPPSFRPERKPLPPRTPAPTGRIHNIGKFLLDARDLQKLASLVADPQASGVRRLTTYQSPEGTEMFGRLTTASPCATNQGNAGAYAGENRPPHRRHRLCLIGSTAVPMPAICRLTMMPNWSACTFSVCTPRLRKSTNCWATRTFRLSFCSPTKDTQSSPIAVSPSSSALPKSKMPRL